MIVKLAYSSRVCCVVSSGRRPSENRRGNACSGRHLQEQSTQRTNRHTCHVTRRSGRTISSLSGSALNMLYHCKLQRVVLGLLHVLLFCFFKGGAAVLVTIAFAVVRLPPLLLAPWRVMLVLLSLLRSLLKLPLLLLPQRVLAIGQVGLPVAHHGADDYIEVRRPLCVHRCLRKPLQTGLPTCLPVFVDSTSSISR